jgi:beta-lactamase regulating signal transducer with metallopeptidase domain
MNWLQGVAEVSVERILNALPEGILIAAFAWVLLRVLRRQNSGTRFAVWFTALLTVAALPLLAAFDRSGLLNTTQISLVSTSLFSTSWERLRPAFTMPAHWALIAFAFWMMGASLLIMRLAAGLWRLRQLRRSCIPLVAADLDPHVRRTVEAIYGSASANSASKPMPITIATSEHVRVPSAIGFLKRTIILPAWTLRELPANDLNVILLHEFAHLRRGDDWTNLVQKIVRALFFFHPAVWWIEKQLSVEREMACDDAVLAETANPKGYANCLVSLLEKSLAHKQWSMAQAAVHRAREASLRLAQILDSNRPAATRIWKPAIGMISGLALVCLVALPVAPQFVAFDHTVANGALNDSMYPVAGGRSSIQSSFRGPAVVPVVLRTGPSSVIAKSMPAKITRAHVARERNFASSQTDISRLSKRPDYVVETSANVGAKRGPQFQTLVFIEATQYGSPNAPLWSVQVWRVTVVSGVKERTAGIPAANSI